MLDTILKIITILGIVVCAYFLYEISQKESVVDSQPVLPYLSADIIAEAESPDPPVIEMNLYAVVMALDPFSLQAKVNAFAKQNKSFEPEGTSQLTFIDVTPDGEPYVRVLYSQIMWKD